MGFEGFVVPSVAQYPDQRDAQDAGITPGGTGMTMLAAAIANRNNARVDIPVIGDSGTEGQGATTFLNRFIGQANRAIRTAYPTTANLAIGGEGFIPILSTGETTFTWPITLNSGAPTPLDFGPARAAYIFGTPGGNWSWTAPAGTTSVKIMYYDVNAPGSFTWQINSGGLTTVNNTLTEKDLLTASITITSGEVLTIAWASGECIIDGIVHYAGDENSGITFHGCGHGGWGAGPAGWTSPEFVGGFDWAQCYGAFNPAAIAIALGANDASEAAAAPTTAAAFQVNLGNLVALLRSQSALATVPILFVIEYQINEAFADPGGWPAYVAAIRNVQAATSLSGILCDLNYRMPPVVSGFDGGAYYIDNDHPTNLGHVLIGEMVAAGARIA